MQAIMVSEFGGPEVLRVQEAPVPQPGPDEVLVRVMAAGVGPWDVSMRSGGWTGPMPYIPGAEFAGLVEGDTGADASFDDGTPVYGYPGLSGCYAQYVACPIERLAPIPAGLPLVDAAGTPVDAMTAVQGITDVLDVTRGDTVLITAGSGGLGHFAVQIAHNLGANVISTASPRNHELVHQLGAAEVVDHTDPDWPDLVRKFAAGGVDKVLATVAPTLEGAARAARDGAVIATPVHAELPDAANVQWKPYDGKERGSSLIRLAPWFDDGSLSVTIQGRYFFRDAAQAHAAVESGHTRGKVVLVVDEDLAATMEV
ncbi:MAG TPA: NADP-dependent oxidoreductase [Streptosporangiaceae bacterium]|jgi:NADPH:quinone reductase-like Zn-dependent oxidoreductase|nr:NADP-dependent oxidoreductase [Streptosporangiaceae bacterium]